MCMMLLLDFSIAFNWNSKIILVDVHWLTILIKNKVDNCK